MDPGLATMISSGISSLASVGGSLSANYANTNMNKENREWNEKMWNLSNEYNLPVNQIQRFQSAGLNPNLVYGNGTSSLSSYAGNLPQGIPMENVGKDVQFSLGVVEKKKLENETRVAESQENLNNQEAELKAKESQKLSNEIEYQPRKFQTRFFKC